MPKKVQSILLIVQTRSNIRSNNKYCENGKQHTTSKLKSRGLNPIN